MLTIESINEGNSEALDVVITAFGLFYYQTMTFDLSFEFREIPFERNNQVIYFNLEQEHHNHWEYKLICFENSSIRGFLYCSVYL